MEYFKFEGHEDEYKKGRI